MSEFHDPILCKNYDVAYVTSQPNIVFIKKESSPYWFITKEGKRYSVFANYPERNACCKIYFDKYEDLVAFVV